MIPDSDVYNPATAQRLLIWGIRCHKPVWTFSAEVVKAGAFAGQFSEIPSAARQTAQLAQKILAGADISKIDLLYPKTIKQAVNLRTADIVGINLNKQLLDSGTLYFEKQ